MINGVYDIDGHHSIEAAQKPILPDNLFAPIQYSKPS